MDVQAYNTGRHTKYNLIYSITTEKAKRKQNRDPNIDQVINIDGIKSELQQFQ